jgi:glycogen debranching enzyme
MGRSRRRRVRRVRAPLPRGLRNQGWKDSRDAIVHADGSLAQAPIALVEVQSYVYEAKLRIADVYEALGEAPRAGRLRTEAGASRAALARRRISPRRYQPSRRR